ncbi:hypothetical protein TIFTF001_025148 [Ficus carica]|uniref:Ubiquitin-like protease family profile domain-containing protein n=1 Tax=Ficus carica TaxID=3494 RepID=A0AA88AIA3_FICCA|nr:hypothetical protein TIFTF001_025148 [Ficus carica]
MNRAMKHLAYYAHISMRQGNQIEVPIPYTIMGFDMPVFLSFEDIYEFINLQEISANCILVYMRYLEELCRINGQAEKFVFVSPSLISPVRTDTEDAGRRERADNLLSFLRDAPKERLYLVPHNRGRHWVLGVIDPWEDLVLYFDPLREKKRDDFTELMNMALADWKITTGEGIRRRRDCKTKFSNRPCPLQEGSVECGYFILGFMRDIVLNGIDALETGQVGELRSNLAAFLALNPVTKLLKVSGHTNSKIRPPLNLVLPFSFSHYNRPFGHIWAPNSLVLLGNILGETPTLKTLNLP